MIIGFRRRSDIHWIQREMLPAIARFKSKRSNRIFVSSSLTSAMPRVKARKYIFKKKSVEDFSGAKLLHEPVFLISLTQSVNVYLSFSP